MLSISSGADESGIIPEYSESFSASSLYGSVLKSGFAEIFLSLGNGRDEIGLFSFTFEDTRVLQFRSAYLTTKPSLTILTQD